MTSTGGAHRAREAEDDAGAVRHDETQALLVADGAVDGVDVLELISRRQLEPPVGERLRCSRQSRLQR